MVHELERVIGGRVLTIQTGLLAGQAGGAVTIRYGETVVLITACASTQPRLGIDFFPLTVDYEERLYAAGKIPGGFFRREGRPSQEATLAARLTDRTIRPIFPKGFRNDVQVIVTVLSADQENDPDILAILGASSALCISEIPFGGPVSAVRIGWTNGQFLINPTFTQLRESQLDLVVASTRDAVVMVEAGASEVPESVLLEAVQLGQRVNTDLIQLQEELINAAGKPKLQVEARAAVAPDVAAAIAARLQGSMADILSTLPQAEREEDLAARREELLSQIGDEFSTADIEAVFASELRREVRSNILERGRRQDGRAPAEIRPITCEVGILPRTHGSGLFSRGQTQVLSIATLGSPRQAQTIDTISQEESRRFLHHYNFPPFSTGEARRIGSPGRREIGHGALAERALQAVIPDEKRFPYTLRLVSEVLSSNGSTSMASVCASTLSLMDAGVPIKAPVAGVAMGLIAGEGSQFTILTDIAGMEDALGDMDFKVAGTAQGVTALQMDVKVQGITHSIMEQALTQAREARLFILDKMLQTLESSRTQLSPYAPRLIRLSVDPDKVRNVIGPGGRTIRSLTEEFKVTIDVEDDGTVYIGSSNEEMAQKAVKAIQNLTRDVTVGEVYTGKVTRIMNFGAFVEILPGKDGLVHISELADYRVASVEDEVKVGDEIMVKVVEIDAMGRINLSRRAVLSGQSEATTPRTAGPRFSPPSPEQPPRRDEERPDRGPGGRGSGGDGGRPFSRERRPEPPRNGPVRRAPFSPRGGGPRGNPPPHRSP